jgi:hypothetical protein
MARHAADVVDVVVGATTGGGFAHVVRQLDGGVGVVSNPGKQADDPIHFSSVDFRHRMQRHQRVKDGQVDLVVADGRGNLSHQHGINLEVGVALRHPQREFICPTSCIASPSAPPAEF